MSIAVKSYREVKAMLVNDECGCGEEDGCKYCRSFPAIGVEVMLECGTRVFYKYATRGWKYEKVTLPNGVRTKSRVRCTRPPTYSVTYPQSD